MAVVVARQINLHETVVQVNNDANAIIGGDLDAVVCAQYLNKVFPFIVPQKASAKQHLNKAGAIERVDQLPWQRLLLAVDLHKAIQMHANLLVAEVHCH